MNNLSNVGLSKEQEDRHCCKPIPTPAIYVLLILFLIGLGFSLFILIVIHNALFLLLLLCLSALVAAFLLWNSRQYTRSGALLFYLHSFPDSDLSHARHGQLVKVTGVVSCGNVSLESSYEKVNQCIYTSTLLYEFGELGLKLAGIGESCFQCRLAYSEVLKEVIISAFIMMPLYCYTCESMQSLRGKHQMLTDRFWVFMMGLET